SKCSPITRTEDPTWHGLPARAVKLLSSRASGPCHGMLKLSELARESRRRPVWLRVGGLIDGVSNEVRSDVDLVFDAREIRAVGSGIEGQREPDAVLPDFTVLPCLIEAHAHLFLDGATIAFDQRDVYLKNPADWMRGRARARWPKIL